MRERGNKIAAQKIENQRETSEPSPGGGLAPLFYFIELSGGENISFISDFHAYVMNEISMEAGTGDRACGREGSESMR